MVEAPQSRLRSLHPPLKSLHPFAVLSAIILITDLNLEAQSIRHTSQGAIPLVQLRLHYNPSRPIFDRPQAHPIIRRIRRNRRTRTHRRQLSLVEVINIHFLNIHQLTVPVRANTLFRIPIVTAILPDSWEGL